MKKLILSFVAIVGFHFVINAQNKEATWDNTLSKNWPEGFVPVKIKSSADGKIQNAVFYKSVQAKPQPLIISLHTWSGDYLQEDPLAAEVLLRNWNYIHPDFRGPNNNPEACGSELVIRDIDDAIRFAIQNGNVDTSEVHIIGVSGGGYATMLAYMKLRFPAKSFSAWASISNLEDWYWECKGRNLKYASDLEGVTTSGNSFDVAEARSRSPLFMPFKSEKRKKSSIHIYAGIHDGYTGSVPITHSTNMFNKLLLEMYPEQTNKRVSDSQQIELLAKRTISNPDTSLVLGGRKVHLIRESPNLSLAIFEGGHEMIVPQALAMIPIDGKRNTQKLTILTIGDSNGAAETGWPNQLKKLFPFSTIINKSISGNTIGFDNLDQEKLNTLKNIDRYLDEAYIGLGQENEFDVILIGLGTNDTKKVFENRQKEVVENLAILVQKVKQLVSKKQSEIPEIVIISPSPMDELKVNQEKYSGGDSRIQKNNQLFKKLAVKNQVDFLDTYTSLKKEISEKTTDGVHLNEKAQFEMASEIANYIRAK
jgi:lysophospholipase L1-like esterase